MRPASNPVCSSRFVNGANRPIFCAKAVAAAGLNDSDVRINVAKNLPTIFVDSRLIQQALGALLSNAVGHGNACQSISAQRAMIRCLVISVADHGPGLAPGEEHKVFEKFYRGPRDAPGGLAWDFRSRVN